MCVCKLFFLCKLTLVVNVQAQYFVHTAHLVSLRVFQVQESMAAPNDDILQSCVCLWNYI